MDTQLPIQHILTPQTENYLFRDQLLSPLLHRENVTVLCIPHGGINIKISFLIKNSKLFGYEELGKHLLVYVDLNELTENSPEGYFQLMIYKLDPKENQKDENISSLFLLKEKIKQYLQDDFRLIFILAHLNKLDYPTTFFNNLHSLHQMDRNNIHFIFIPTNNVLLESNLQKYGQLSASLTQNVAYFPILSKEDSLFAFSYLTRQYGYSINEDQLSKTYNIVGGYPALGLACMRIMIKNTNLSEKEILDLLRQQWEVKTIFGEIWESITTEEKVTLSQLASDNLPTKSIISDYLLKTGLIYKTEKSIKVFSPLFESFIRDQKNENPVLTIDEKTGEILVNGLPPKEKITLNEHRLLTSFLQSHNEIISRDKVAEILWGKNYFQKYSDWTIDQMISLLRKKMDKLGISSSSLQTIRNRGYRWVA